MNCSRIIFLPSCILAALLVASLLAPMQSYACTTVIVSAGKSATGRPLLWKNRDSEESLSYIEHFQGKLYGFTGLVDSDDSLHRVWAGANDQGFCIVNNLSYNLRPESYEGKAMNSGRLMKEALGSCATVEEFAEFISDQKSRGVSANFGVIDARGGAAYFEVWNEGCTRYDVSDSPDGYLYRTNFSLSGDPAGGKGYARYQTAGALLKKAPKGKISVEWLIDGLGRSFYNELSGSDMLRGARGMEMGEEFIPRYLSNSSIVFEGAGADDKPSSTVLWTVLGYSPCSYAVPVWVAAGNHIPGFLTADATTHICQAASLSEALKAKVFPLASSSRDARDKYLDASALKRILPYERRMERCEFKTARPLDERFRASGIDVKAVREYNKAAAARFEGYRQAISKRMGL